MAPADMFTRAFFALLFSSARRRGFENQRIGPDQHVGDAIMATSEVRERRRPLLLRALLPGRRWPIGSTATAAGHDRHVGRTANGERTAPRHIARHKSKKNTVRFSARCITRYSVGFFFNETVSRVHFTVPPGPSGKLSEL